jgi:hypothetical protein
MAPVQILNEMERMQGPFSGRQSGAQAFASNQSGVWIADELAQGDITFPSGDWAVDLVSDQTWGSHYVANPEYDPDDPLSPPDILVSDMQLKVGYTDNRTFTSFTDGARVDSAVSREGDNYLIVHCVFVGVSSEMVPRGSYLALYVKNNSTQTCNIYTGENHYASCLSSPESDPGYPAPEMAAVFLLGGGLIGLGGYILIGRRKAARRQIN